MNARNIDFLKVPNLGSCRPYLDENSGWDTDADKLAERAFTDFLTWEDGKWDAFHEQAVAAEPPWKIVAIQLLHATKHVVGDTLENMVDFFELVPELDLNYHDWELHSLEEYKEKSDALLDVFRHFMSEFHISKHTLTQVLISNLAKSHKNLAEHNSTELGAMRASIQKLAQYQFDMLDEMRTIRKEVKDEMKEVKDEMTAMMEHLAEKEKEPESIKKQDDPEAPKKVTPAKKATPAKQTAQSKKATPKKAEPTKKRKRDEPVEHESSPVTKKAKK